MVVEEAICQVFIESRSKLGLNTTEQDCHDFTYFAKRKNEIYLNSRRIRRGRQSLLCCFVTDGAWFYPVKIPAQEVLYTLA